MTLEYESSEHYLSLFLMLFISAWLVWHQRQCSSLVDFFSSGVCFQGEIDAREDSFVSCAEAGERLVSSNHYAAEEVREKVQFFQPDSFTH